MESVFAKIGTAFELGGFWMWPILLAQIVSIGVIIERVYALFIKRKIGEAKLANEFENDIRTGQIQRVFEKASALAERSVVARTIASGCHAAMNLGGRDEIQSKMDEVLIKENANLEKRTGYLAMLGNVGTLLGLLGTIIGMIVAFASLANADQVTKSALLAEGISEAMHCTAFGLIMAIPALVMFAVLQSRANDLAEDLHEGAHKAFNWLSYSYNPLALRPNRVAAKTQSPGQLEVDA